MAQGTVVHAWHDGENAYLAVAVTEESPIGVVEYIGAVALGSLAGLTLVQQLAELLSACQAERALMLTPAPVPLPGIAAGTAVTV